MLIAHLEAVNAHFLSSTLADFKDVGDGPELADSLNCAQVVTLGKLGFLECSDMQ
jgi:hypothetical protein